MFKKYVLVIRLLAKILINSHQFYKSDDGLPPQNFKGYWGMVKNGQLFISIPGLSAISNELRVEPNSLRSVLMDWGWEYAHVRPMPSLNPIRGVWVPINLALLGKWGRP